MRRHGGRPRHIRRNRPITASTRELPGSAGRSPASVHAHLAGGPSGGGWAAPYAPAPVAEFLPRFSRCRRVTARSRPRASAPTRDRAAAAARSGRAVPRRDGDGPHRHTPAHRHRDANQLPGESARTVRRAGRMLQRLPDWSFLSRCSRLTHVVPRSRGGYLPQEQPVQLLCSPVQPNQRGPAHGNLMARLAEYARPA